MSGFEFYSPNLAFKKAFLKRKRSAVVQWQNINVRLLKTNDQRITRFKPEEVYTTTNNRYEVVMISLNLSYTFNGTKNKTKVLKSKFGEKEF
nr:outer membrane beta-barrel protein [Cellulophaga sp. L1A9]